MYLNNDAEMLYFCRDFNARTGNFKDSFEDIDSMPPRHVLDNVVSGHEEALINFVNDCRLFILNGRLYPQNDNFAYISDKSKSVVDYIITPQD